MTNFFTKTATFALVSGALALAAGNSLAADKKPAAAPVAEKKAPAPAPKGADPTGSWTYTMKGPDGQERERTVKLVRDGEKLTGSTTGRQNNEIPLSDGSFKNGEVAFSIVRERDGNKMVANYKGKLEGDVIKGTMVGNFGGEARTVPWEAKRAK